MKSLVCIVGLLCCWGCANLPPAPDTIASQATPTFHRVVVPPFETQLLRLGDSDDQEAIEEFRAIPNLKHWLTERLDWPPISPAPCSQSFITANFLTSS